MFSRCLDPPSYWTDLSCQSIKLVGKRPLACTGDRELSLANHVHEFDAGQHVSSRTKGFEVEHWWSRA